MTLNIHHTTHYTFDEQIFLEPHYFKFSPLPRPYYQVLDFKIILDPLPSGISERSGIESNIYYQSWFNEKTDFLNIDVQISLDIKKNNPFDFYIDMPFGFDSPELYHEFEKEALIFYLTPIVMSEKLAAWSQDIRDSAGDNLISYLSFLNQSIHSEIEYEIRMESDIMSPDELFDKKAGSCRDLSWMMIQLLRQQGLAARFVSGYSFNPELQEGHELHAWVDVYLPGGGWIGLDPSAGIFTTETYIPVCASFDPEYTKPVIGNYRGSAASSMKSSVRIGLEG